MTIRTLGDVALEGQHSSYDVCIIGGGVAGLLTASRLATTSRLRVAVLESGGTDVEEGAQALNELADDSARFTSAVGGRFRGLGGSSARWGGRFMPIASEEVGPRDYLSEPGWPVDLRRWETHRPTLEAIFGLPTASYEEDVLDTIDRRRLIPRGDEDIAVRVPKWAAYDRCNLGALLRKPLQESRSVDVILDATVCDFQFGENGRLSTATGRSIRGGEISVAATHFVLAAGPIECTRMLLLADALCDGRIFADCSALGRYLQDHVGVRAGRLDIVDPAKTNQMFGYRFTGSSRRSVHLELSPQAQRERGAPAAFAQVIMEAEADSATDVLRRLLRGRQSGVAWRKGDLATLVGSSGELARGAWWRVVRRQHYWPPDLQHAVHIWIEQMPRQENRISLSSERDVLGVPKARVEWSIGEDEDRTFLAYAGALRDYWRRNDLDKRCRLEFDDTVVGANASPSASAIQVNHPSGTTRMGKNPATSVVGTDLRCHQIPNLHVVSASVFPTAGGAGPTYTVGLMALGVAEEIATTLQPSR